MNLHLVRNAYTISIQVTSSDKITTSTTTESPSTSTVPSTEETSSPKKCKIVFLPTIPLDKLFVGGYFRKIKPRVICTKVTPKPMKNANQTKIPIVSTTEPSIALLYMARARVT